MGIRSFLVGTLARAYLVLAACGCGTREGSERPRDTATVGTAAALAPVGLTVSAERDLDIPVRSPADGTSFRIAAGAASHLVTFTGSPGTGSQSLYGARVSFEGAVLDPYPFPITSSPADYHPPVEMAFNGSDWLVVWPDRRNNLSSELFAARIAPDGSVRDPNGIPVAVASAGVTSVTSDGSGFLVVSQDLGVRATLVDATGTVVRQFTVREGASEGSGAFNGTHYLVAYGETVPSAVHLRAERLTPTGDPVGGVIDLGVATGGGAVAASDGTDWLIAYSAASGLAWRVVRADGSLGPSGSFSAAHGAFSLSWGGSAYWLTARAGLPLTLVRIGAQGELLGSARHDVEVSPTSAVVHGGGTPFVAYQESVGFTPVFGSRLTSELALIDDPPVVLSASANSHNDVRAANGAGGYLTVFTDSRDTPRTNYVHARRVGADGVPADSRGFRVSPESGQDADVAFGANAYLVAWQASPSGEIRGTRLSASGVMLDEPNGFRIARSGSSPAVASNGTDYYVTWQSDGLRGARVLSSGLLSGSSVTFSERSVDAPAIASNGSRYLIAWSELGRVKAKRTDDNGTILDATAIDIVREWVGAGRTQVASDGRDWFVVWEASNGVGGARIAANGTVSDASSLVIDSAATAGSGSVAWTGEAYLVAWSRQDLNVGTILGQRFSACGGVLDSTPFTISAGGPLVFSDSIDLAGDDQGSALVTYTRADADLVARRAHARTITGGEPDDCGAGGAAGAGTGGGAGISVGGADGGASGESSGGAGEGAGEGPGGASSGGSGVAGTSGGSGGSAGTTSGASSNDDGRGSRRVVTEGCGCRTPGVPKSNGTVLLAWVAVLLMSRPRRLFPRRPIAQQLRQVAARQRSP